MEITRFKRDDGMWNFIKSDGSFLSNEFFKLAYSFSMGWQQFKELMDYITLLTLMVAF